MGIFLRDAAQQGCCARAYMDVFTAFPQKYPHGCAVGWELGGGGALQGLPVLAEADAGVGCFEHALALDDIGGALGKHDGW